MVIQEDSTWSDPELGHCKATDTFWRCGAGTGGVGVEAELGTGARDGEMQLGSGGGSVRHPLR